ncbi:hypothetical protein Tco_0097032 [Tanacetum coccineum]
MSSPKFAETHNVVAFLEKPVESDGFAEIIDFLKASSVHYALTVNPIIYTSCIQQFWATANVKMVNGVRQLQALIDKKKMIITESSIRSDLHLEDAEGKDFSGRITPLFDTMMVQASEEVGKDSDHLTDSNKIPIIDQPSVSSQPKQKQNLKKRVDKLEKRRKFRTTGLKRLNKVGAARRIESSNDSLERQDEDLMFDIGVLDGNEKFMDATTGEKDEQSTKLDDSTAGEAVTTAGVEDTMMEVDRLLAERLQTREREELTDEEKGKLFMELIEKRRKHFAELKAQEKRNIPPTKA